MEQNARIPTRENVAMALSSKETPNISLYQPTHRFAPDNRQDVIRFNNLLGRIDESLQQQYSEAERKKLLRPFHELADDRDFWNHTLDGIAILASPNSFDVFTIPRTMPELVVVANSFHKKPLRKFLQSTDQYQLLALSLDEMELYQGNRNFVRPIDPGPDVPKTIDQALGRDIEQEHPTLPAFSTMRGGKVVLSYGHGGGKDERAIDQERWFRAVDNAITEHVSQKSKLPLILVALTEHHAEFRRISQNPHLIEEGITINPKAIGEPELKELAWKLMEPKYHAMLDGHKDDYRLAQSRGLGSDIISDVARAAAEGRVSILFLEEDKILPGHIDRNTGEITQGDLKNPEVDDLLDDLGALVESTGGQVYLIPSKHMPSATGLAAIYRY